jgi:hypothetical protein
VRVLAKTGKPEAISAIESALNDTDHAVRCTAVIALRTINGRQTAEHIMEAVRRHGNYQLNSEAAATISKLDRPEQIGAILDGTANGDYHVRRVLLAAWRARSARADGLAAIARCLETEDAYTRWSAALALSVYGHEPRAVERLMLALNDRHPTVRAAAAASLGKLARTNPDWQGRVLAALQERFHSFGQGYRGPDRDWGFKSTGAALRSIGAPGEEVLRTFLNQHQDAQLSDFAWRCLYLCQDESPNYHLTTAEQAEKAYALHPKGRGRKRLTSNLTCHIMP